MILEGTPDSSPVFACWFQITLHVAARDAVREIHAAVDHEQPREEEMPASPHGKPLPARNRRPGRELVLELDNGGLARVGGFGERELLRDFENGGLPAVRGVAPVECGMFVEDLQAAHQQRCEGDDVDPVRDAHEQAVAAVEITLWHEEVNRWRQYLN